MTAGVGVGAAEGPSLRRIQGGISMRPRTARLVCLVTALLSGAFSGPSALADPLYAIRDLGTLSGQSSSVATAINNQGQVVGISYNASDGHFASGLTGVEAPPRFDQTGSGARSFLYSDGQMAQISPTGGLAMSINSSGQVVGGPNSSINDSGRYVAGAYSGIDTGNHVINPQIISPTGATALPPLFDPYAINNQGQVAGSLTVNAHGGTDTHPAVFQDGQVTDLFSKVANGEYYGSAAIAINQNGDVLMTVSPMGGTVHSYIYHTGTDTVTDLSSLPGGSGMIAAALNSKDQAVGNGFLYSDGTIQALATLISSGNGWSNLNATAINDSGQIVGQGQIDGHEHAFLMTPIAMETPEPGPLAIWGLVSAVVAVRLAKRRTRRLA